MRVSVHHADKINNERLKVFRLVDVCARASASSAAKLAQNEAACRGAKRYLARVANCFGLACRFRLTPASWRAILTWSGLLGSKPRQPSASPFS